MGDWHISIQGLGCHDNGIAEDVEARTAAFVEQLVAIGHHVSSAVVTTGGKHDVTPASEHLGGLEVGDVIGLPDGKDYRVTGFSSDVPILEPVDPPVKP